MSNHDKPVTSSETSLTYRDAGVDIDAGNKLVDAIKPMIKATDRPGVTGNIGGFGGLFDLKASGYADPLLVAANDGVGTKLKLAFETGIHHTVGIDLIAMCVNDLIVQGAEPLFFLDYFACGHLESGTAEKVISGIARGCEIAGCALLGGETAEMPGMYGTGEYDLAGFAVGAVERAKLLPRGDINPGDKVLGLASSGVHSNGFSLVRRVAEHASLKFSDAAPFDPSKTLGEALLTPTKIYVAPLLKALSANVQVKALAHITGGGLIENIPRVLPKGLSCQIDLASLTPQLVFSWLKQAGNIKDEEMLRTFNLGTGMILITAGNHTAETIKRLEDQGERVTIIGELTDSDTAFSTINQLEFHNLK